MTTKVTIDGLTLDLDRAGCVKQEVDGSMTILIQKDEIEFLIHIDQHGPDSIVYVFEVK